MQERIKKFSNGEGEKNHRRIQLYFRSVALIYLYKMPTLVIIKSKNRKTVKLSRKAKRLMEE